MWRTDIAPSILSLGARWRYVVNITSWPLYHRDTTLVPVGQEAGFDPEPVWRLSRKIF